jgi:hypothetical protein
MFDQALDDCRENLGPAPRRISLWDRFTYWRVPRPGWLKADPHDKLNGIYRQVPHVYRHGEVVWGYIVMANVELFAPGENDLPALITFSLGSRSVDPEELEEVAHRIFALKNTEPDDPALAPFAAEITDEYSRKTGRQVPKGLSPRFRCFCSTVQIFRKHLPSPAHHLQASLVPLIVDPEPPHRTIILPARYWPEEFVDWWTG